MVFETEEFLQKEAWEGVDNRQLSLNGQRRLFISIETKCVGFRLRVGLFHKGPDGVTNCIYKYFYKLYLHVFLQIVFTSIFTNGI